MLKKAILYGRMVNARIKVLLNSLSFNFVMRACFKPASVYKHNQGRWSIHVSLPKIDHLVGVITVGNIFVCDRRRCGEVLRLNSEASDVYDQKCGGK
jgi:hypothetical protein